MSSHSVPICSRKLPSNGAGPVSRTAALGGRLCRPFDLLGKHAGQFLLTYPFQVAVGIGIFYLALVSSKWQMFPDSACYLLMAQGVCEGQGLSIFGTAQGKYPPGFTLYLAGLLKTGLAWMLVLNGLMVVMALGSLMMSYLLLCEFTTRRWALLSTVVVAMLYKLVMLSVSQLSDVPCLLLIVSGLYCFARGRRDGPWWLAAGVLLLLIAGWFRVVGIPLAIGAAVGLLFERSQASRSAIWLSVVTLVAGSLITGGWLYQRDRALQTVAVAAPATYAHSVTPLLESGPAEQIARPLWHAYQGGPFLAQFLTGQQMSPAMALVLFWLPGLAGAAWAVTRRQYLLVFATAGYLGAVLLVDPPITRYYLPIAPILVLYLVYGIRAIARRAGARPALAANLAIALLMVCVAANVPKNLRQLYRQHTDTYHEDVKVTMASAAQFLRREAADLQTPVRFLMDRGDLVVAYLSGQECLHLGKVAARRSIADHQVDDLLEREQISHVLVWLPPRKVRAMHQVIRQQVQNSPDYQIVFARDDLQIFRPRAWPQSAEHRAGSPHRK